MLPGLWGCLACLSFIPQMHSSPWRLPVDISMVDMLLQWRPVYTIFVLALFLLGFIISRWIQGLAPLPWPDRARTTPQALIPGHTVTSVHSSPGYHGVIFDEMMHFEVAGTRYVSLAVVQVSTDLRLAFDCLLCQGRRSSFSCRPCKLTLVRLQNAFLAASMPSLLSLPSFGPRSIALSRQIGC